MNHKKRAISLIEITIGVLVSAILIVGLMNLFSSGMKGSAKGLAHQANMEAASILMAQIEYDLLKATSINSPDVNMKDDGASWNFYYAASGKDYPVTVNYSKSLNGITRNVVDNINNKTLFNNVFAKDHNVSLSFLHFQVNPSNNKQVVKDCMWVELKVDSKDNKTGTTKTEPFTMKRLIIIRNQL